MKNLKLIVLLFLVITMAIATLASCDLANNGQQETTVGDTTVEDTTTVEEDTTAEDTTAEDTTIEDTTAVEDTTVEDTTVEDTTVEDTTVEDTTVEDTTVEDTTVEDTTVEDTTVEDTTEEETTVHVHEFVEGKCECGETDPNYVPPHVHEFVEGKCECGETDPNYVPPHVHNFVEGKCECGETDPNYVPPHVHNFVEGKCECGETDPDYVAPNPPAAGGSADFGSIVLPSSKPNGDSGYTGSYTTESGWVTSNSAIQCGGSTVMNPQFPVIGPDNTHKAVCLNGKVSAPGKIVSPTLVGGLSKLTINYTKMFTDTALSVTVTVTELSTGNAYTHVISQTLDKNDKYIVYTDEWVLETPVTGDFTIEIVNNCPSAATGNKDRFTVLGVEWEGAADVHTHNYATEITTPATCTTTGLATYTCSCGDSYTEELPVAEHVDANLDITCDFEGCTKRIIPAADSKVSLFTARHMIIVSLSGNYYVEGVVTEVRDAKNGVFVITDADGESILIRLPKNADGASYSAWTIGKIVVGDVISVYGKPTRNTGSVNSDMDTKVENGILTVLQHEHVFADPDCVTPATCACLATDAPALGHIDEDASGFCDRCDWNVKHAIESIKVHYNDVKNTENYDATTGTATWTGTNFSVAVSKGTGTFSTSASTHVRLQANNELTIASVNGEKIVSLVLVVSAESYVDELEALLTKEGYQYTTNGVEVTVQIDSLDCVVIKNTTSKSTRLTDVKVIYEIPTV